jgi:hypothetical protein
VKLTKKMFFLSNVLSDQMDISDDDQMDWEVVEPLAPGMTNLQIESCLKG